MSGDATSGRQTMVVCTPAYGAAEKGHEGCLRVLKEAGCDLGQADDPAW